MQNKLSRIKAPRQPPTNLRRRAVIRNLVELGLSALVPLASSFAHASSLIVGQSAPPLTLHTLDGRNFATTDLIGYVVVITFWASYCEPCKEELPALSAYAESHKKSGLEVLGFCIDSPDNVAEVSKIASTLSFPVGFLGSQYAGDYGRIWRMPVSFVIDRKGRLIDNGWNDKQPIWNKERFHRVLDPLFS